ncbi:MAG: hypothetical protein NT159_02195 [Proteobacteria bacterium]|nr:hypothetical protein [Pseudomonadota bacterium]
MTTLTKSSVGRQLLASLLANNEPEFVRILDAHCLQLRGNSVDFEAEIARVIEQIREGETTLGLDCDLASSKTIKTQMKDRLATKREELLAA